MLLFEGIASRLSQYRLYVGGVLEHFVEGGCNSYLYGGGTRNEGAVTHLRDILWDLIRSRGLQKRGEVGMHKDIPI